MHVDAYGNLHVCQGIVIGNLFREPLKEIAARYNPDGHYIVGPLLVGGPAQLARTYGLEHEPDICRCLPPVLQHAPGAAQPFSRTS